MLNNCKLVTWLPGLIVKFLFPVDIDHILIVLSHEPDAIVSELIHSNPYTAEVWLVYVLINVQFDGDHILTSLSLEQVATYS